MSLDTRIKPYFFRTFLLAFLYCLILFILGNVWVDLLQLNPARLHVHIVLLAKTHNLLLFHFVLYQFPVSLIQTSQCGTVKITHTLISLLCNQFPTGICTLEFLD